MVWITPSVEIDGFVTKGEDMDAWLPFASFLKVNVKNIRVFSSQHAGVILRNMVLGCFCVPFRCRMYEMPDFSFNLFF